MAENEAAGEKKKSKLPLIIIAVAVLVVGGGAAFFFMSGGKSDKHAAAGGKTEAAKEEPKAEAKAEHGEGGKAGDVGEIVTMNELVVNPKNTRGNRFFLASIGIVCPTKLLADEAKKKEPLIRDRLILFFSLQTLEVLSDINRREQIKTYVKAIVDRELSAPVKEVLFSRYIVQ